MVDAGLATLVDVVTAEAYSQFENKWLEQHQNNEDFSDIYSDFFEELFEQNTEQHPQFNQDSWLFFTIPDTDLIVPMVSSGWGDGYYPVYFGYDAQGEVCEVLVDFLLFEEEDDVWIDHYR
ncbi:hypothetical protein A6A20_04775 [Volucribacter amazonae]|uniref:Uncharacterized protein n=1 Tax=Volucribacter amazonae TaxID=256731 RepID=A0A9X4PGW3_9PAST|nr:hypothetical protein [Volucribacter amazonae]